MTDQINNARVVGNAAHALMPDFKTYCGPVWSDQTDSRFVLYRNNRVAVCWNSIAGRYEALSLVVVVK